MTALNEIIDGRFHLRAPLGAGAWGELFIAEDKPKYGALAGGFARNGALDAGAGVIVEIVAEAALPADSRADAIEREMKAFKGLMSPHLLACLECGRETVGRSAGAVYLAMEYWTESLDECLKSSSPVSEEDVETIARGISRAIAHLHENGLHHAGVHPQRIVSVGGKWKLVPSGPAGRSGPRIVAPERKTGTAEDIYAFGLTFLHAFLVARGRRVELDELASDHERWLAELPEVWRVLFSRCLQIDPRRRCTAEDLFSVKAPPARPILDLTPEPADTSDHTHDRAPASEQRTIAALERRKRELDGEIATVQAEIQAARQNRSIRVGIFGVRDSGKSSLLAAWSLFCVDRSDPHCELQIRFPDDDSLRYLKEVRTPILKTGKSQATAMAEPKKITFEIVTDEAGQREVWKIETMDFSGEFVELMADKTGVKALAQQTHDFLKSSDVVLCCHRWDDNSQETLEAVNRVLAEYGSQFILALTRLDERGQVPRTKQDLEAVLQAMEEQSPVYFGNLLASIQDICRRAGRVGVMAICPLGKNFSDPRNQPRGRDLTVEDLQPIAIHEPLRFAIERRRQVEPRIQERLRRLQLEQTRTQASLDSANADRERQRQSQSVEVKKEVSELRTRILQCLDQGQLPSQKDRHELSQLGRKATDCGDLEMARQCGDLLKKITSASGRKAARRRRSIETIVLLAIGVLLAAPVIWLIWYLLGRRN